MKTSLRLLILLLLGSMSLSFASAHGQSEDSISLSPKFMRDLESAFSFQSQTSADIVSIQPHTLDQEQLHEWIGAIKVDPKTLPFGGVDAVSIAALSPEALTKASYLWKHGQYGILLPNAATGSAGCITGIDVNALGQYIRPKEIELRKLRALTAKIRPMMDRYFPMEGAPLYAKSDTLCCK